MASPVQEFPCLTCGTKVVYDPNDPMLSTDGAMLVRPKVTGRKLTVYLTCEKGHLHRYEVTES